MWKQTAPHPAYHVVGMWRGARSFLQSSIFPLPFIPTTFSSWSWHRKYSQGYIFWFQHLDYQPWSLFQWSWQDGCVRTSPVKASLGWFSFWTVVLEKTLESPLDCKEMQPVHPKGDQSWVSIGRTDVEAETPLLWPPDAKSWLIWKDPDAGKDWGQEEKGKTEDEMVGWHHWLDGHGFGWTLGVVDGQGGLVCCSSWGRKELDTTEQLNWTEMVQKWG